MSDNKSKPRSPAVDYLAAAIPAAAYDVVFGPLETVNNIAHRQAKQLKLDRITVLKDLLKSSSLLQLSMPLSYRYVITQGLDFTLKEAINSRLNLSDQTWPVMLATHFATGAIAGLTSFTILYPEDIVTNQQVINKKTGQTVPVPPKQVIKSVWELKGWRGFYYRYGQNAPAVAFNKGIYFGVYDTIKHHALDEEHRSWFSMNFLAGCASSFLATVVPHPLFLASSNTTPKISYGQAVKEELRTFTSWKFPSLSIRSVRGGLLLATFDKITSLVYHGRNKTTKKKKPVKEEKYIL